MKKTFLVGVDGSDESTRAAAFAADEARAHEAHLLLLYVIDWSGFELLDMASLSERHAEKEAELAHAHSTILEPLKSAINLNALSFELVAIHGHIAEKICWYAENEGVSHVFTGKRGRGTLANLVLGSVSSSLTQSCPVPITVVP